MDYVKELWDLIKDKVQIMINRASYNRSVLATVTAVSGSNLSLQIVGQNNILTNVPNKTNATINVNDKVWCLVMNNDLSLIVALFKA